MSSNCLIAGKINKGRDVIKPFVSLFIFCLIVFLLNSSSPESPQKRNIVPKAQVVLLKFKGGMAGRHYLIEILTAGSTSGKFAVLPQAKFFVIDDKEEKKEVLHTQTDYTIKVSETESQDADELVARFNGSEKKATILLKTINFTPKEDTNVLTINLNEDEN